MIKDMGSSGDNTSTHKNDLELCSYMFSYLL